MTTTKSLTNVTVFDMLPGRSTPTAYTKTNSSFSLSSSRLNVEYVTKSEMKLPIKKLFDVPELSNKQQSAGQTKSQTTFGNYSSSSKPETKRPAMPIKVSISNKKDLRASLRESQKKLLNRFISKEDCKGYLEQLRMRDYLEKQTAIKISEGISCQNKSKFDYYMKNVVESSGCFEPRQEKRVFDDKLRLFGTIKTYNEFKDFKNDYMVFAPTDNRSNSNTHMNRHLLPSLLNQIRLTNFSNEYNTKKMIQLERHQKRYYKDIKTVTGYYDRPEEKTPAYNVSHDYIQLNTSFYVANDDYVKTDDMKDDEEYECAKVGQEVQAVLNSKELEITNNRESSNLTRPLETPVDASVVEPSTANVFVTNMSARSERSSVSPHGVSRFSSNKSDKYQMPAKSGSNPPVDDDPYLLDYIDDDINILSRSLK
jgi:hypothetical protein